MLTINATMRMVVFSRHKKFLNESCRFLAVTTLKMKNNDPLEKLKTNPFFEKYSEKIEDFQKTAPEKFLFKLDEANKKHKKSYDEHKERPFSQRGTPTASIGQSYTKHDKGLEAIMKTELIKDKTPDEITEIWKEYHKVQEKISAIIPAYVYSQIYERTKEFPIFLFPMPRSQGYEFIVSAIENHNCYFTTLINYQAYKENAPPCLTINHYSDFMEEKGIVLMRGEFDKNTLNAIEAQCLANQFQMYYTSPPQSRKYGLLQTFTHRPNSFKHAELIAEFENFSVGL